MVYCIPLAKVYISLTIMEYKELLELFFWKSKNKCILFDIVTFCLQLLIYEVVYSTPRMVLQPLLGPGLP